MSIARFSLPVMDTINLAWNKVSGAKASIWGALGLLFLIQIGTQIAQAILFAIPFVGVIIGVPAAIAFTVAITLLTYGVLYVGLRRAKGEAISYKDMFYPMDWSLALNLIGLTVLNVVIIIALEIFAFLGTMMFTLGMLGGILGGLMIAAAVIAAIIIMVRISLSALFMLDERTSPIDALKKSFYATDGNFWNLLGLLIMLWLAVVISAIPLFIGLIWTLPLAWIALPTAYLRLRNQK